MPVRQYPVTLTVHIQKGFTQSFGWDGPVALGWSGQGGPHGNLDSPRKLWEHGWLNLTSDH